jgi:MFS transporter, FHS family, glucose/mannose:H+ symporter
VEVCPLPVSERRLRVGPNALAYAAFIPTGLITVLLGPLLPTLAARWSLNDTQGGYLFTAEFLGSLLGTVSSGPLVSRIRFRPTMVAGLAMMGIGAATLLSGSYAWGIASVFCFGVGIGLTVPTTNLVVARAARGDSSSSLNLLNFFWSAGAVACPFLLAAFQLRGHINFLLFAVAAFFGLLILGLLIIPLDILDVGSDSASLQKETFHHTLCSPIAFLLGALFFVYVGTESAFGAWLASYAKRIIASQGQAWVTVPSYFYGALLIGRLAAPLTLRRLSGLTQARWGAILAVAGATTLLVSHSLSGAIISSLLIGLGFSSLYPIAIGMMSSSFGAAAPRAASVLFALSTLGGAVVPWSVGYASTESGSLRTALLVPFFGCCIIATLFWNPLSAKCHAE